MAARLPFCGGPLGAGREFLDHFFTVDDHDIVFGNPDADARFRGFLSALHTERLDELPVPVVSTLGFAVHFLATRHNWVFYAQEPDFLSSELFADTVTEMAAGALAFYRTLRAFNLRVLAVLPPQRVPAHADPAVFLAAQDVLRDRVAATGAEIVDIRDLTTDADGLQLEELCEPADAIHGNLAWGRVVLAELLDYGI